MSTKAERQGKRPEGYCRLVFDDEVGYWVYVKKGKRYRATDLTWPNHCQYPMGEKPSVPKLDSSFEPYPLEILAHALHCTPTDVLEIIGRYGEFYRKKTNVLEIMSRKKR